MNFNENTSTINNSTREQTDVPNQRDTSTISASYGINNDHNDDDHDDDDHDDDVVHNDNDHNDDDHDDDVVHNDNDDHDDCLLCPICKDLLIIPRLYNCGHNICEECMLSTDKVLDDDSNYSIPIYRCPICREETLQKWYDRPINNTLIDLLCKISSEYKIRHNNHKRRKLSDIPEKNIPSTVNLAYVSQHIREYKAEVLYKQIIPILYRAAIDGKSYVTITTAAHDISVVADILAKKLIDRNGIYRFTSMNRECQIELVPSERSYRCEFDNPNYNTTDPIISTNQNTNDTNVTTTNVSAIQSSSLENLNVDDVIAVSITDINGNQISDPESRQLSNFLVNHVIRNLSTQRNLSNL